MADITPTPELDIPAADDRAWAPKVDELIEEAMERAGINKEAENTVFWKSAFRTIQLIQTKWASEAVYLPTVYEYKFETTKSSPDYELPPGTIGIVVGSYEDQDTEILLNGVTYEYYQNYPYKNGPQSEENRPFQYFLDLRSNVDPETGEKQGPRIRFIPVPDENYDITLQLQMMPKQIVGPNDSIETAERWIEAFVAEIAARLCLKFGDPERYGILRGEASECYMKARKSDTTKQPIKISHHRWF